MSRLLYLLFPVLLANASFAQTTLSCNAIAGSPLVRQEGLTERTGDLVFTCTVGIPGAQVSGNLTLFLSANITNHVAQNSPNTVTDVVFTVDNGSGPQPVNVPGFLTAPGTLVYNGISFTLSPSGAAQLRLANLRVAANQMPDLPNTPITALISIRFGTEIVLNSNQFTVATTQRGLYTGFSSKIVCVQSGSLLPSDISSLDAFLHSHATFNTTRVTEGFASSFSPRSDFQGLNAATGTRIIARYGGFPAGARLFVPTAVAGSDAVQPTAGGDFGLPASGGMYAAAGGSLLLSLVQGADSNGTGGTPVVTPATLGAGTVALNGVSELALVNGSATAVYEVVDADPFVQESAQFPTFLGLAPFTGMQAETTEDVSFAPVSNITSASATAPIPRFASLTPPPDCTLVGDCDAQYFPVLFVTQTSLDFTAPAGSPSQAGYVIVQNKAGGILRWTATLRYQTGSGWLHLDTSDGVNNGGVRVDAIPGTLAPGTYKATLNIDAGPLAGARDIPITLTVTPSPPSPTVTSVVNGATFAIGPLAPGSIATVLGSLFSGAGLTASFDGAPAQILFSNDTQINVVVPAALGSKKSAELIVAANGLHSKPFSVTLARFAPGIFANGILNEDNTVNGAAHPAALISTIQIFATGLSGEGAITARLGDQIIDKPYYAGPAPGLPGVQQVDLILPSVLPPSPLTVSVCGGATPDQVVCSPPVEIAIAP